MAERWTPAYARLFDPEHELRKREPVCRAFAWLDLCHLAQWGPRNQVFGSTVISLERGTVLASLRFLADRWSWSKDRVARFLQVLSHAHIRKIETVTETPAGTVYRIVKYETYALSGGGERDSHKDSDETATRQVLEGSRKKQSTDEGAKTRKMGLPPDWEPNETHARIALEEGRSLAREADKFRDSALAHGRRYLDWDRAFCTWLRNEFGRNGNGTPTAKSGALERPRL